ncbi:MAG TPA: transposase [Longimicrobium sp.]|jgi:REP element-mobilizing transposase RayT
MSELQKRKTIRLAEYDYSRAGMYFVTICSHQREMLFGDVHQETISLSNFGRIVQECWDLIPAHYPGVATDAFVIMPNHVHGLIRLTGIVGARHASPDAAAARMRPPSVGNVVGSFKSAVSSRINSARGTPGAPVWQRGFFERVLRDDDELLRARRYIVENPLKWYVDEENPLRRLPTR